MTLLILNCNWNSQKPETNSYTLKRRFDIIRKSLISFLKCLYTFISPIPPEMPGFILESKSKDAILQKKRQNNVKKGQDIRKFGQKCKKFENFLKKSHSAIIVAHINYY